MLFKKKLKGFGIQTPMGDALGKVDDLLLDIKTWKVSKLVVSPGALKKDVTYDLSAISKFDEEGRKIIISPKVEPGGIPEYPTHSAILLTDLMGKKVMTSDDEKLKKVIQNFQSAELSERKQHLVEYAVKLTKTPYFIFKKDIDILQQSGFSDEEILNINLITCYFNFVNRIALGLGVTFSKEEVSGYNY